jgi:glycosyltransferase involved in cell wall biosynthesis
MRNYESRKQELVVPIQKTLAERGLKTAVLRYGAYRETQFRTLLKRSKALIYLSEHETQGLARLQAHSCGVPILAWDQGGFWENPSYFPHQVRFSPVTSVPDWDERCGVKFKNMDEFPARLAEFLKLLSAGRFAPREYVLENFTLEKCAGEYLRIVNELQASLNR